MKEWKSNKKTLTVMVLFGIVILAVLIFLVYKLLAGKAHDSAANANVSYESGYEALVQLGQTEYEKMSLKEFDDYIMQQFEGKKYTFHDAMESVQGKVGDEDENSKLINKTLAASLSEVYQLKKTPYLPFSATVKYTDFKEGSKDINLTGAVYYEVSSPSKVNVRSRDESLEKLTVKVENYANQMFLTELSKEEVRSQIESRFSEWQKEVSTNEITFRLGLTSVEIK